MNYLKKFYGFAAKYKGKMVFFLAVVTISVVAESLRPYWLKVILDAAGKGDLNSMWVAFAWLSGCMVGGNLIASWSFYLGNRIMISLSKDIRETVFGKIMDLDFAYHVNKSTGGLISAFKRGDGAVWNIFFNIHNEVYRVLINLFVVEYFLWMADREMALMMAGLVVISVAIILWLVKINLKARREFNEAEDEVSAVITDSLINYETVKFFAAENKERLHLKQRLVGWTEKFWRSDNSFRLMDVTIGTISGGGTLIILGLAIGKLNHGFSVGDLVMVSGFLTSFYYQFFNLFFRVRDIAKSMSDLEKYLDILDNRPAVVDPEINKQLEKPVGKIELRRVSFCYPQDKRQTLTGINLTIEPGENVAFVGRSGAGKTTIIKLLLRFYDPSEGEILIDNVNIKDIKKGYLRSLVGIVPQEPIMFNNTLRYNLTYGKDGATDAEIMQAAETAQILEFIEKLPERWETKVGERGIKLSGGQKQRLAIARALLTDPKILIFDEATSNLDSESETKIQEALKTISQNRTVIIIAHRFSTIRHVDKIVVLANGKIVDMGKHADLVAKDGVYQKLWTLQAKGKLV